MRKHQPLCIQQTRVGTLMWPEGTLICLLFPLSQLLPNDISATKTQLFAIIQLVLFTKASCTTSHQRQNFCRDEWGIKAGILVIKAIEFPVDLRRDLNAPCLHSLWGGAGNINGSPFYLIPCQKQSLWRVGPGGHLAQSCSTHTQTPFFFSKQHTHFQVFDQCTFLTTDDLECS